MGYVEKAEKKGKFVSENYRDRRGTFGLIVFKSKADLAPLDVYLAYAQRWMIETLFWLYKNNIDRDTVNVHNDYGTYATEFVNFLAVIITTRVKNCSSKPKSARNTPTKWFSSSCRNTRKSKQDKTVHGRLRQC